jgi:hypothetical protein
MSKIIEIAESVNAHYEEEIKAYIENKAVARIYATCNDKPQIYWLIVRGAIKAYANDFIDGKKIFIGFEPKSKSLDGTSIPRDGMLGAKFIQEMGNFKHKGGNGNINTFNILNKATYNPFAGEIKDILIKLNGDEHDYRYASINELFKKIQELRQQKEEDQKKLNQALQTQKEQDVQKFSENIKNIEKAEKSLIVKGRNFIRKGFEMRYQPILDPIQDSVRRENIFDENSLIINGGPGTGKTISLVQRIKFLISPTIEKEESKEEAGYFNLNKEQKGILFNKRNNWIFFSPSELLSLFLRDTIVKEGLEANSNNVKVWEDHKRVLIKLYTIDKKGENSVFLFPNKNDTWALNSLLKNKSENVKNLKKEFEEFYIRKQKGKLEKVLNAEIDNYSWTEIGKKIQESLINLNSINNITSLLREFISLRIKYKSENDKLIEELKDKVEKLSNKLQMRLQENKQKYDKISDLINKINSNEETDEDEDEEVDEQNLRDNQIKLARRLRKICKREGLRKIISNPRTELALLQLIPEINEPEYNDELIAIGELTYFESLFKKILIGSAENTILNEIPKIYKEFRLDCYMNNNVNYCLSILEQVIDIGESKKENRKIHKDEQAFLLYFINNFCYDLAKKMPALFEEANHKYIEGYKNNCKPIIGIDEATDFSIIDLLAMYSLKNNCINSVTFSGDILQAITNDGLESWSDISSIINTNKKDLNISYRQSNRLVKLAKDMHSSITGKEAKYESYLQESKDDPKPLIFINEDEYRKSEWISDRIKEINNKYQEAIQQLPSIAVFTQTEEDANDITILLSDWLEESGIRVRYCRGGEVLGDSNSVRVYCIKEIKGLEFEACFIHNFDKLQNQNSEVAIKYLYVGLSRAAFYLGLTSSAEFNDKLKFMNNHFDREGDWS